MSWKHNAKNTLKSYYLSFRGSQWDEYLTGSDEEKKLLLAKICFANYGPPTQEATDILDGYTSEQKEFADKILKLLLEANNQCKKILISIIFIYCKSIDSDNEFVLPLFSVFTGNDPAKDVESRKYVDTQLRVYKNFNDWLSSNRLPKVEYAYPGYGFFSCSSIPEYEFDESKDPYILFSMSPACSWSSSFFSFTDKLTGITAFTCGVVSIVGMFTPLAPIVVMSAAVGGSSSAVYGTVRAVDRLIDKGTHGESMKDMESWTLYFSIAASPLHFVSSMTNAALVQGATQNGRIFSNSTRLFATILNFSTLGVDTVLLSFGIANLIDKASKKQLTTLDVLQFSMSVFFFTNTLIQPKTAAAIIERAQDLHINQYADQMSDQDAQKAFNKFLDQNKGSGSITDKSKIVRTINKIQNPDKLFGQLKDATDVRIGGRKGNSLVINGDTKQSFRIGTRTAHKVDINISSRTNPASLQRNVNNCIEKINDNGIFSNLNDRQKFRTNKTLGNAAGNNERIVQKAVEICVQMIKISPDDVLSMIEILVAELKKKLGGNVDIRHVGDLELNKIDTPEFRRQIYADCHKASEINSKSNNLNFQSDLEAVYHYRKHGQDFANVLQNQKIEVYLTDVPKNLIKPENLVSIDHITINGETIVTSTYNKPNNDIAIVVQDANGTSIRSMYNKPNSYRPPEAINPQFHAQLMANIEYLVAQQYNYRANNVPIFINFDDPEHRYRFI